MKLSKLVSLILLLLSSSLAAQALEPGWGNEPIETLSETRSRICLNGLWKFAPDGTTAAPSTDSSEWGLKHVPGAWVNTHWNMQLRESIHSQGTGTRWAGVDYRNLDSAWYARPLHVPADWAGSSVILDLTRVSTDAVVYVDGKKAGEVFWPNGKVDITEFVTPGQVAQLSIQVVATISEAVTLNFMATADSQVHTVETKLNHRGIIGEVFLHKEPLGGHIDDVFVMTSVRESKLQLEVTLDESVQASALDLLVEAYDQDGNLGFQAQAQVSYDPDLQDSIQLSAPWEDPKLWDFGEPNLYTLHLTVSGEGILDDYTQRFGFREFWIEGRQFYLNDRPVNLRPIKTYDGDATGNVENIRKHIRQYMAMGHNIGELWPSNHLERGMGHYRDLWKEIADEEGFGLIATLPSVNRYIMDTRWRNVWSENRERYGREVMPELMLFRNHPSVLFWVNSGNFFGHSQDQNPRALGRQTEVHAAWHSKEAAGLEAIAMIKAADPTRPVATHQGAQVGDVFMTNFYLNVLPLQDRIEWLSDYMENGTMPFMPVEMGTPLDSTFKRGRNGFGNNVRSEPLMTEYVAIYQGAGAYRGEPDTYRADIARLHQGGTAYGYSQNLPSMVTAPTFQEHQVIFTEATYRAWRTWGNSAGMIAWVDGHGWSRGPGSNERIPSSEPFTPGHRGTWLPSIERYKIAQNSSEAAWEQLPAGDAMVAANQPTLAWIAGTPDVFTERSHNFTSNSDVTKQIVLINDRNDAADYHVDWSIHLRGMANPMEPLTGNIDASGKIFLPITLPLPEVSEQVDGSIEMTATIGDATHTDSFEFTIFPDQATLSINAEVVDPKGMTTQMLEDIGVDIETTSGENSLLIYGREALGSSTALPAQALDAIRGGGTVLVMIQDRDWYRQLLGFRIADHISRQVFPVQAGHPVLTGLDASDLNVWNGEASLIEAYPDVTSDEVKKGSHGVPYYGWRWGSRGAVSSAMIEKPHFSAWTPILEGEFDLAYSPLMELNVGSGRVILCSLDLEDMAVNDPAAAKIAKQILSYAAEPTTVTPRQVFYYGSDEGKASLDSMGLHYTTVTGKPTELGLLIVDDLNRVSLETLRSYAENGGDVLILPQLESNSGLTLRREPQAGSFSEVPDWPEARGLSISELRTRAPISLMVLANSDEIETTSNGLLGRIETSGGSIIFSQLSATALDADQNNYMRYTRWRFNRATAQLIANMGGTFEGDRRLFTPPSSEVTSISLAEEWSYVITQSIPDPDVETHRDPGASELAKQLAQIQEPLTGSVQQLNVPNMISEFDDVNGEAVLQYRFELPASMVGQDLELGLGRIDDVDATAVNGRYVGSDSGWNKDRLYRVPASILREGENVISVRVWDQFGGGGFSGNQKDFFLRIPGSNSTSVSYHPDYIDDFALGDDPYRYYRW